MRRFVLFIVGAVESFFFEEFEGGGEVVLEEAPAVGIQVIDEVDQLGIVKAVVSEQVPDMAPVFLFDMGVVICFVGS